MAKKVQKTSIKKVTKKKVPPPTKKEIKKVVSLAPKPRIMPLGDRVLIRPFTAEEVAKPNSFGLIIPDTVKKERPEQGEVIAVGEGRYENGKLVAPKVRPGDVVMFSKYGFDDVTIDGKELYILKEENILAIINN